MKSFLFFLIFLASAIELQAKTLLSAALEKAQDEQLNFQEQKAVKTLTAALDSFKGSRPDLEDLAHLPDTYLFLAFCLKNMGETVKMNEALDEAARLNPSLTPSEMLFAPSLIARFEEAKDRIWGQKRFATLLMESNPSGARIFVNGAFKGMAPLRLDRHPDGIHHIYAVLDKKRAYKQVSLKAGEFSKIRLKLKGR